MWRPGSFLWHLFVCFLLNLYNYILSFIFKAFYFYLVLSSAVYLFSAFIRNDDLRLIMVQWFFQCSKGLIPPNVMAKSSYSYRMCPLLHGSIAFLEIASWQFNTFWHKDLDFYDIYMFLYDMISHNIIICIYIYIKTNIWYHVMLYCIFLKCTVLYTCVQCTSTGVIASRPIPPGTASLPVISANARPALVHNEAGSPRPETWRWIVGASHVTRSLNNWDEL